MDFKNYILTEARDNIKLSKVKINPNVQVAGAKYLIYVIKKGSSDILLCSVNAKVLKNNYERIRDLNNYKNDRLKKFNGNQLYIDILDSAINEKELQIKMEQYKNYTTKNVENLDFKNQGVVDFKYDIRIDDKIKNMSKEDLETYHYYIYLYRDKKTNKPLYVGQGSNAKTNNKKDFSRARDIKVGHNYVAENYDATDLILEIIHREATKEDINCAETYYIKYWDTLYPNGLNKSKGTSRCKDASYKPTKIITKIEVKDGIKTKNFGTEWNYRIILDTKDSRKLTDLEILELKEQGDFNSMQTVTQSKVYENTYIVKYNNLKNITTVLETGVLDLKSNYKKLQEGVNIILVNSSQSFKFKGKFKELFAGNRVLAIKLRIKYGLKSIKEIKEDPKLTKKYLLDKYPSEKIWR
jgi:hypothetical protein